MRASQGVLALGVAVAVAGLVFLCCGAVPVAAQEITPSSSEVYNCLLTIFFALIAIIVAVIFGAFFSRKGK